MPYVIKSKVVQYHGIPIIAFQFLREVPGNVIVNFREVLMRYIQWYAIGHCLDQTDRHKEARRPICTIKGFRE